MACSDGTTVWGYFSEGNKKNLGSLISGTEGLVLNLSSFVPHPYTILAIHSRSQWQYFLSVASVHDKLKAWEISHRFLKLNIPLPFGTSKWKAGSCISFSRWSQFSDLFACHCKARLRPVKHELVLQEMTAECCRKSPSGRKSCVCSG